MTNQETNDNQISSNILDKIIGSQTQSHLTNFQPVTLVENLLDLLKDREKDIVKSRFGLNESEMETLEAIGKRLNLTRERVRQIEKDSLNTLKKKNLPQLGSSLQLIFDTIVEHGSIISQSELITTLLPGGFDEQEKRAVTFLLTLGDEFKQYKETNQYYESWSIVGFNFAKLEEVLDEFIKILKSAGRVLSQEELFFKFKETAYFKTHKMELTDKVLRSYLGVSKILQINPFKEFGLRFWAEVKPKDVGDKAYLVLKHHGKPEHYSVITKMINESKFDHRVAYQETVHNELIKDSRFVLVGRGIYALSEWGYKKGVVADVIREVMQSLNRPLSREEIIDYVMKKRQVKRNTILVGLSNRKFFQKTEKDKYILANNE